MRILPPAFHSLSSNQYGSLFLQLSNISTNFNHQSTHYQPLFFGYECDSKQNLNSANFKSLNNKASTFDNAKIGETMQYKVMTNQWSFYMYLSDMEDLQIQIMDNSIHLGFVTIPIGLKSSKEVMNPEFMQDQIFSIERENYAVRDVEGNTIGQVKIKIWTEFDKSIHQQIKCLINFHEMVVFQGISPINSDTEIPRELPPQISISNSQISNKLYSQPISSYVSVSHHKAELLPQQQEQHSRMIEQDIDKMIMQMQSKPYDPRQYQDNDAKESKLKEKQNKFSKTMQNFSIEKSENEFVSSKQFLVTEASMRRPPSYCNLSKTKSFTEKSLDKKYSLNNSQRIIKGENLADRNQILRPWRESSHIEIIIHQLQFSLCNSIPHTVFTNFVQTCYSLRIYLNNNTEQNFICQGVKQGETVKFNQKLELKNINDIQSVKFIICDDYGKIQCEGVFDLSRLYENKKGIFIVSMSPVMGNVQRSTISVSENKLMEVSPLLRTLRIQAEVIEKIQLVQIFIKISNISIPFNLLRYKIPMSKQTINHIGPDHINIFPHNCSSQTPDKILLEFWRNEQNIGQSEISLKNIKNTNLATFNINIDPTYLYDGKKQIKNFLDGDRIVGDFNLSLCFGTITQMQSVLLANIEREKQMIKSKQNNQKIGVSFDDRLGVMVKNKPIIQNEVSIQVEIAEEKEQIETKNFLQKSATFPHPQFCNQSMISHASHASLNQQNQFMNDSFASFSATVKNNVEAIPQIGMRQTNLQTVTQKICKETEQLLEPVVKWLQKIKELCKPHLLYNIIEVNTLKQIFSKVGITNQSIDKIFKLILFAKEGMISINYLYDFCACIQIQGHIEQKLIHDQMFIVGAMRIVYRSESERKGILLETDMQFREMVEIFRKIGLRLTLNQFQTLHKFLSKYKTKTDCQNLKQAVISEIDSETVQQIKQGFYQEDIVKQIYGDESQSFNSLNSSLNQSYFNAKCEKRLQLKNIPSPNPHKSSCEEKIQKGQVSHQNSEILDSLKNQRKFPRQRSLSKSPKPNKLQRFNILINGIENVKQTAFCIFDELPKNTYLRIVIESPIFEELTFKQSENIKSFEAASDLKDIDGRVDYVGDGKVLACAAISLIKDLESVYLMNTKEGAFCGLLKIQWE